MNYIVIVGCKNPYTAKPFTLADDIENDVYSDSRSAQSLADQLNDVEGEGYARVVVL
jgi:hypothetical protein